MQSLTFCLKVISDTIGQNILYGIENGTKKISCIENERSRDEIF